MRALLLLLPALALLSGTAFATELTAAALHGDRLAVYNQNGEIWVTAWNENRIRVLAEHAPGTAVRLRQRNRLHTVDVEPGYSEYAEVIYRISVPSWMPVEIEGVNTPVVIDGLRDGVRVETVNGSVHADRVGGELEFSSVNGNVRVRDARGRVRASSINQDVALELIDGNVFGEAVNGDIVLRTVTGDTIYTTTVRGDVYFSGRFRPRGRYLFSTHSGDVNVQLPKETDASVESFVFSGDFITNFPLSKSERTHSKRHKGHAKKYNFQLGSGDARLELESFEGDITLDWLENARIR